MSKAVMGRKVVACGDRQAGDEHQRRRALGFWSMTATGGAAAVGLLLGGVLTQYAG